MSKQVRDNAPYKAASEADEVAKTVKSTSAKAQKPPRSSVVTGPGTPPVQSNSPPHSSPVPSTTVSAKNSPTPSISGSPKTSSGQVSRTSSGGSTDSTLTRATKLPVPGGRSTPDGRLRKSILVYLFVDYGELSACLHTPDRLVSTTSDLKIGSSKF